MVADMNAIGTNQVQSAVTDNPKQQNNKTGSNEFSEALKKKNDDSNNASVAEVKSGDNKDLKNGASNEKSSPASADIKESKELSANLVSKTNVDSKSAESELVKALKNKNVDDVSKKDDKQNLEDKDGKSKSQIEQDEIKDKLSAKTDKQDKAKLNTKGDTKKVDKQQADIESSKTDDKPVSIDENDIMLLADSITDGIETGQSLNANQDIKDNRGNLSSLDSKKTQTKDIATNDDKAIKTLNDVKKEAQARNLNLQQIEIIEDGKKNKINPQDLMDMDTIENNKERLSYSLQDKGNAVATSLARTIGSDSNEMSKKDALLADLLNRYDASANAKRKAQNDMEKLQFKINEGDKSMVVGRTSVQPKNIVDSKFRNEVMEQEFLEQLHDITGDEDLGELIDANKAKIKNHLAFNSDKLKQAQDILQKTSQALMQQPQVLEAKDLKGPKHGVFELDVQTPFDPLFSENLKTDIGKKENNLTSQSEKKIDDIQKEKVDSKQDVGNVQTKQEVNMKNAMAREAMKNFASQLRDEILNYKPPITKINLELNPASLGQVSMTISKKGKDLQVSITSNSSVMTMFVQNAQELRQNLMQIGFNNLDLNFNAHDGQGSNQQQGSNTNDNASNPKLQNMEEAEAQVQMGNIPQSLEILIPQYA